MKRTFLLLLSTLAYFFSGAQSFTMKTPMPTARFMAVSAAIGAKVYVIGGQSSNGPILNTTEEYDVTNDTWTSRANFPTPILQSFACGYNNKLYVVGGCTGSQSLSSVWEYDPSTDQWTSKSPMPTSRCEISGALINGKIYITSGWSSSYRTLEIYDIASDSWTTAANAPIGLMQINSGTDYQGKFYAIGGKNYMNTLWYDSVMVFDPSVSSWTLGPNIPQPLYAGTAVSYNGRIHYFGGGTALSLSASNSHFVYDTVSSWQFGLAMPTDLYAPTSVRVSVGEVQKLFIFGGKNANNVVSNVTIEYSETPLNLPSINNHVASVQVWVNPGQDQLTVEVKDYSGTQLKLVNINGATVRNEAMIQNEHRMNLHGLASGVYVLQVNQLKQSGVYKVIIP